MNWIFVTIHARCLFIVSSIHWILFRLRAPFIHMYVRCTYSICVDVPLTNISKIYVANGRKNIHSQFIVIQPIENVISINQPVENFINEYKNMCIIQNAKKTTTAISNMMTNDIRIDFVILSLSEKNKFNINKCETEWLTLVVNLWFPADYVNQWY